MHSIPNAFSDYELLGYCIEPLPDSNIDTEKDTPVEECMLNIIILKSQKKIEESKDVYKAITEIVNYLENTNYTLWQNISYSDILANGTITRRLVNKLILQKEMKLMEKLIFGNPKAYRLGWELSQILFQSLKEKLSTEEKSLVALLISDEEPLNDYWKEKLKTKYPELKD